MEAAKEIQFKEGNIFKITIDNILMKNFLFKRLFVIATITIFLGLISFFIILVSTVEDPTLEKRKIGARIYRLIVVEHATMKFYENNHRIPNSLDDILGYMDEKGKELVLSKKEEEIYSWIIEGETETNPQPDEINKYLVCLVLQASSEGKLIRGRIHLKVEKEIKKSKK